MCSPRVTFCRVPPVVAPGEKAYSIDAVNLPEGTNKEGIGATEAQLSFETTDAPDTSFEFDKVKFHVSEFDDKEIEVRGVVHNTSDVGAEDATIGLVAFDANGKILGGFVDNDSKPIRANDSRGFRSWYPDLRGNPDKVKDYFAGVMPTSF